MRTNSHVQKFEDIVSKCGCTGMNNTRYILAHRDMHMGNMLYDRASRKITAILDWELAAILPYQLWNPGNFLHDLKSNPAKRKDTLSCKDVFIRICQERGNGLLVEEQFKTVTHENVQKAID